MKCLLASLIFVATAHAQCEILCTQTNLFPNVTFEGLGGPVGSPMLLGVTADVSAQEGTVTEAAVPGVVSGDMATFNLSLQGLDGYERVALELPNELFHTEWESFSAKIMIKVKNAVENITALTCSFRSKQ